MDTIDTLEERLEILVPNLYPKWRDSQIEVINQIINSDKKIVALQASTGFGKSLVAIASIILNNRGIVVTQTKQLGDKYFLDYGQIGLKSVKGRQNFTCEIIPERTVDIAPCSAGYKCELKKSGCAYYSQKRQAVSSKLTSMNISYFLTEVNYSGEFSGRNILFIDEAHKLDTSLQQFIEVRLNKRRFNELDCSLPQEITYESIVNWAQVSYKYLLSLLSNLQDKLSINFNDEFLISEGIKLNNSMRLIEQISITDKNWIIEENDYNILLKPVWIDKYIRQFLLSHASKVVLMSATLPRKTVERLGITDYDYINIPSNFDPERRPVIWYPVANLSYSAKDKDLELKKLRIAVDKLCENHIKEKGIIHTTNYKITKYLIENCESSPRFIYHNNAEERQNALTKFEKSKINSILISPSFTEGIDLPYDLIRFQIICKIPFMDLSDKQTNIRMKEDNEWYSTQAIITMIQAYGRIMRAPDDSGTTYILDTSLLNLIKRWKKIFNQLNWFLEALWIQKDNKLVKFNDLEQL